jgi:hypothetical protein
MFILPTIIMINIIITAKDTLPSSIPEVTVGMKRCAAYEVTALARQKVVMESNPAYEQVICMHQL